MAARRAGEEAVSLFERTRRGPRAEEFRQWRLNLSGRRPSKRDEDTVPEPTAGRRRRLASMNAGGAA